MFLSKQYVPAVRIALVCLFVVAVLIQFGAVPIAANTSAAQYPEYAYLARPYTIAVGIAIGLFEATLIAAWFVLTSATDARARRQRAWATIFTVSLISSAVLVAGIFIHAGSVEQIGGPPMLFGLVAASVVIVVAIVLRRKTFELAVVDPES